MTLPTKTASSIACALAALLMTGGAVSAGVADAWAWKYRLVAVFAPDTGSASLAEQRERLAAVRQEMLSRDMVVVEVVDGRTEPLLGADLAIDGAALRNYAGKTDDGFEVVLFGKDTGVKLRSTDPVSANAVFELVDRMPMRRREVREGS